jgi:hypothetical protein
MRSKNQLVALSLIALAGICAWVGGQEASPRPPEPLRSQIGLKARESKNKVTVALPPDAGERLVLLDANVPGAAENPQEPRR